MKLTTVLYKDNDNVNHVKVFGSSSQAVLFANTKDKSLVLTDNTYTLLPIYKVEYWFHGWIHLCYCTKDQLAIKEKIAQSKALIDKGVRKTQLKIEGLEEI